MIRFEPNDVVAAREGDRAALDTVVRAAEKPVYNLAMRMLAQPDDAQDATQEILIKIITNLGAVRDIEAAGGWAMRIACRHLLTMKKQGRVEAMRLDFQGFSEDLETGLSDLLHREQDSAETQLAIEEVKVGCTLAMLTCLSRVLRMTYLLGDVFGLSDKEAALILEVDPATYRQRLRRSRDTVSAFVLDHCGVASEIAKCRCEKRVHAALEQSRINILQPLSGDADEDYKDVQTLQPYIRRLESGRRATEMFRSNPDFVSNVSELLLKAIEPLTP